MNRFLIVLLALVAIALASAPAGAQDVPIDAPDVPNGTNGCGEPIPVDNHTAVCDASLDGNTAVLVVYSDRPQRSVVLTSPYREGVIPQSEHYLREGRNRITVRVPETSGDVGVTIDTGRRLVGVSVTSSSSLIAGPFDGRDAQTAAVGGASSVGLVTIYLTFRAVLGKHDEPERIA
ncbi:hypothetical protein [Halorussus halobius]|uniref:hypothetical protein n=1 Tax=Halorussus halobius TaxID=1710537 RepID=UPI001092EFEF|nr:hypothetical protein [Halorussus halobius]